MHGSGIVGDEEAHFFYQGRGSSQGHFPGRRDRILDPMGNFFRQILFPVIPRYNRADSEFRSQGIADCNKVLRWPTFKGFLRTGM